MASPFYYEIETPSYIRYALYLRLYISPIYIVGLTKWHILQRKVPTQ